ncbi:MAG TPA: SGNH/GDSL hydrolase family protein [Nitrospiraceae bacterium]
MALAVIVLAVMALALEGGARVFFAVREQLRNKVVSVDPSVLDDYEVPDSAHSWNWRPKAGYSATIGQIIQAKRENGKIFAEELLKQRATELKISPDTVVMRINAEGFKGPDIDKTHSRVRILTIGDSCTFGTMFDEYSYPRALERELDRLGRPVEVINAGVEGYGPANVLGRIEEFKALRPEITTIYIGWNALYAEPESYGVEYYLKSVHLFRKAYGKVREKIFGRTETALEAYSKPKHVQRDAPEVKALDGFTPRFMTDLERIVKEMRAAGSEVVLLTLPGLFVMDEEPSPQALKVGHLPTFTDNPYVLAKISEEYNKRLRRLAVSQNLVLVDLEEWSNESLKPRDRFFFDSVHLYEEGQTRIGKYLAEQLLPLVNVNSNRLVHT